MQASWQSLFCVAQCHTRAILQCPVMAIWLWGSIWLVERKIDVCVVVYSSHVELKAVQVWWNSACRFPFHLSPFQCPSFPKTFADLVVVKVPSVPGDQSLHLSLELFPNLLQKTAGLLRFGDFVINGLLSATIEFRCCATA